MKKAKIALMAGDGIGPEVIKEAIKVLDAVSKKHSLDLSYNEFPAGGYAVDNFNDPMPQDAIDGVLSCDALLFGAIGGEKWDKLERDLRPETGLLKLRSSIEAFANLRPVFVYDDLVDASSLKPEVVRGVDMLIVRELTGGIYFGKPRVKEQDLAYNTMIYSRSEIERIARVGFEYAQKRRKKLCCVDKANVLEVSVLWREVVQEVHKDFSDVELSFMYVDNAAMQMVRNPRGFDVVLTSNLFGDILSDEASEISGSIGLLPSASMGLKTPMFEPIHGSAPDITGMGIANPIATILSAALMLRYALNEQDAARSIEQAVERVFKKGFATKDLQALKPSKICTTEQMGSAIASEI